MKELLSKLTSRKFIACIIGVIVGIATTFGIDGGTVTDVAGLIVTLASGITYMIVEGKIDKAAVGNIIDSLESLGEIVKDDEKDTEEA